MAESIRLAATDGYAIAATHYAAERADPALAAVFFPGGGIPARVYRHFAAWLAESGVPVLAFDYRGIGASRAGSLRGFTASSEDWAALDGAAAIAWLRERYPRAALAGISHSIGALILTGAPGASALDRFLLIGAHTGYWRDYHPRWRPVMWLTWHAMMPALVRAIGYFPGRALRMGEDLPAGFALQWAGRRTPRFESTSARVEEGLARLQTLEGRALALSFTDDGFATPQGAERLLAMLPRLRAERRVLSPREAGRPAIGHFGFFRAAAREALWPGMLDWLRGGAAR